MFSVFYLPIMIPGNKSHLYYDGRLSYAHITNGVVTPAIQLHVYDDHVAKTDVDIWLPHPK